MTASAVQYRALVVDDEPAIRQALIRALGSENFVCEPAANGREALDWISEFHYDLVVTDVRMPEYNGHTLAVELLALAQRPVIVVLTGVLEPRIANDLRLRGVDDVIFKPIDFRVFAQRARALVEARKKDEAAGDPACKTGNSASQGTDPVSKATEPTSKATEPASKATEPASKATEPASKATEPTPKATEPTSKAAEPAFKATDLASKANGLASKANGSDDQATDEAVESPRTPSKVQNAGTTTEQPPIRPAYVPLGASASAAMSVISPKPPAHDLPPRSGHVSETAESLQAPAPITSGLVQRSVAPVTQEQNETDRLPSCVSANHLVVADHTDDSIAERIAALADQLGKPRESYDGFAIASRGALCIPVLADAVLRNPPLIHDVLRMTNGILHGMSRVLQEAQRPVVAPQPAVTQQPAAHQHPLALVIIFALGICLGWLLSWLSPAAWLR